MFSRLGNVGSFLLCHWLECLCVQQAFLLTPFLCSSAYALFWANCFPKRTPSRNVRKSSFSFFVPAQTQRPLPLLLLAHTPLLLMLLSFLLFFSFCHNGCSPFIIIFNTSNLFLNTIHLFYILILYQLLVFVNSFIVIPIDFYTSDWYICFISRKEVK